MQKDTYKLPNPIPVQPHHDDLTHQQKFIQIKNNNYVDAHEYNEVTRIAICELLGNNPPKGSVFLIPKAMQLIENPEAKLDGDYDVNAPVYVGRLEENNQLHLYDDEHFDDQLEITPLMVACHLNNLNAITSLIEHKADTRRFALDWRTLLLIIVKNNASDSEKANALSLIVNAQKKDKLGSIEDEELYNHCIKNNLFQCLKIIVKHIKLRKFKDKEKDKHPFLLAIEHEAIEMVNLMIPTLPIDDIFKHPRLGNKRSSYALTPMGKALNKLLTDPKFEDQIKKLIESIKNKFAAKPVDLLLYEDYSQLDSTGGILAGLEQAPLEEKEKAAANSSSSSSSASAVSDRSNHSSSSSLWHGVGGGGGIKRPREKGDEGDQQRKKVAKLAR